MAQGSAGSTALSVAESTLFSAADDGGACMTIKVENDAGSSGNALVNVSGIHKAGEWDVLPPGAKEYYRVGNGGITQVLAKSASTSTVRHSVVARAQSYVTA